jgi:hypothetical protein
VLELNKKRPNIRPVTIVIASILATALWAGLQFALPSLMDSLYFRFFLLCFLGFGFLLISFLLKYG